MTKIEVIPNVACPRLQRTPRALFSLRRLVTSVVLRSHFRKSSLLSKYLDACSGRKINPSVDFFLIHNTYNNQHRTSRKLKGPTAQGLICKLLGATLWQKTAQLRNCEAANTRLSSLTNTPWITLSQQHVQDVTLEKTILWNTGFCAVQAQLLQNMHSFLMRKWKRD